MKAWIIYHKKDAEYNHRYIDFYLEEGKRLDVQISLMYVEDLLFGVDQGVWFCTNQGEQISPPDFVIYRTIYPLLSKHLELMGIPVFNNSFVAEICNDKAKTYQYVANLSIKMVDSIFVNNISIGEYMKKITTPTVIKAVSGHGGSQVYLIEPSDGDERKYEIEKAMNKDDVVFQPLTGNRHQDLRVYVIGKQIIAAVVRTANEGFKSNFSLGGSVELYHLSNQEEAIVQSIIALFETDIHMNSGLNLTNNRNIQTKLNHSNNINCTQGFGLVGIDFMIGDQGELIFNEIEDVVGSRMLYQCSDINIVERYLTYIKSRIKE